MIGVGQEVSLSQGRNACLPWDLSLQLLQSVCPGQGGRRLEVGGAAIPAALVVTTVPPFSGTISVQLYASVSDLSWLKIDVFNVWDYFIEQNLE